MSRIARILVRFCVIIAGYVCASLAASAALHVAWIGAVGIDAAQAPWLVVGGATFSVPFVALFVAYFTFLPATVAIAIAELAGWRDWLIYALAGGVIAAVVTSIFWGSRMGEPPLDGPDMPLTGSLRIDDPRVLAALVAAGLVGGVAYWLVAGRDAGGWRRAASYRPPPSA